MKPISSTPHDPLDELLAAALHGELTASERAALDARLATDPAARAAYQEIQHMHDLLEKNYRDAQPDPAFEDRMISAVRRKVRAEKEHRETAWESAVVLWRAMKQPFVARPAWALGAMGLLIVAVLVLMPRMTPLSGLFATRAINRNAEVFDGQTAVSAGLVDLNSTPQRQPELLDDLSIKMRRDRLLSEPPAITKSGEQGSVEAIRVFPYPPASLPPSTPTVTTLNGIHSNTYKVREFPWTTTLTGGDTKVSTTSRATPTTSPAPAMFGSLPTGTSDEVDTRDLAQVIKNQGINYVETAQKGITLSGYVNSSYTDQFAGAGEYDKAARIGTPRAPGAPVAAPTGTTTPTEVGSLPPNYYTGGEQVAQAQQQNIESFKTARADSPDSSVNDRVDLNAKATPSSTQTAAPTEPSRKLVRDAQLDLQVKSYQQTVDAITALAKAGGGYLDSSNSQRGGNGKLQGTVVVKILPENLDGFLLKLRDLGEIQNQSVSTEDVTKDYYDTQARLDNSRRMETQLQELLKRDNGRVSDLLQVERELGRVRGEIEQMQGQLKLYDFQVQYATVTISVAEKDLNQAAAYLLRENDTFSLFVHDVEGAFAQAKAAADASKAEILNADLQHDAGSDMTATLAFSVPPDRIDGFLTRVRALGRVDNFTRQTQRVANDGGDANAPAGETRTEKDPVQVQLTIRADDESPRQVTQIAIASTGDIDTQAQQLKDDAAKSGAAVTASNFERAPDGTETATLTFRLALSKVGDLMPALEKLGRVESLAVQRNDRPDQAAADPGAPAEIRLSLHNVPAIRFEDETPRQETQLAIVSTGDIDAQARQVKNNALKAGLAVTASSFERQPDGTESAALTFRVPLAGAADFTTTLEKLGHVESLAVQRNDVTGDASTDPNAPAEISLTLHNAPAFVADDRGIGATLRRTFGHGIAAFLGSVEMVGVLVAFVLPWVVALAVLAWIGRRIYIARKRV